MYTPSQPTELFGRADEAAATRTLLARTTQAHGQVVLLIGEAGIGKSRLLTHLRAQAETEGLTVIRGECVEQDQDFPYAPILDGLRTHFSGLTTAGLQDVIGPFAQEIVKLLPELSLRLDAVQTLAPLEPEAEKRRLFEVLVQIYQRLARTGLLLIFEDLHWCDANSLEFLQTLTRRIGQLPIMVALSSRLPAPDGDLDRLRLYLERADNAQILALQPLDEAAVEALTRKLLPDVAPLHPALLEQLYTLAQGNPLYTEQIVYALLQNRQINLVNETWMLTSATGTVEIPTSVTRTVQQQTAHLSDDARHILQFAAVAGRQFDLDSLQQLTGYDEARLTGLVKELITRRLLEEVARDRFAFRHALLRQAIYDGLLIRERQALHVALLRISEEAGAGQPERRLAELSYHAYAAQVWDAAQRYGLQAGQRALALHSPRAAIEHFSHALEAADRLGEQRSWTLLMQRGQAYDDLGEFAQALADYTAAQQAAADAGDEGAEWQTLMDLALLWAARDYQQAEGYCRRALQLAEALGDSRRIGHSLNRLGNWYLNTGQPFAALDYHQRALAAFEALDDLAGKAETLDLLGMTSGHVLQLQSQLDCYREAARIFRTLDDRKALASTLANLALCTLDAASAEEAIELAHQIGWYSGEAYAAMTAGYVHSFYGHIDQSFACFERSRKLSQAIDHSQWLAGVQVFSGFVYRDAFDLEAAASHVEQGVQLATAVGSHWFSEMGRGLLAQIRFDQGQFDAAADLLAQHPVPDPPAMQHLMAMMADAALALARNDVQAALAANERLRRVWPVEIEAIPLRAFVTVPYLKIEAGAMARLGRPTEAIETLQRARRVCVHAGLLPALLHVEIMLGQIAAQHDEALAQDALQRAHACAEQLADHVPADMRRRFRQQAESRIRTAHRADRQPDTRRGRSGASPFQLTRRELDIVREVAAGKSNQQVADHLHITVKTVEAHVTRILSKLDLTSRTQIALWAVDNGSLPPADS